MFDSSTVASSSSSAMTTFHPFPRLPAELRNAVWELSLDPREVAIKANYQGEMAGDNFHVVVHFSSPTAIPSALQACRDSRYLLASRHYTRAFGNGTTPHYIWIAFTLDTIRICDIDLLQLVCLPDPLAIRYLTIDCPSHSLSALNRCHSAAFAQCKIALLKPSPLQRVSIVCAEEYRPWPSINATCADKWESFLRHETFQRQKSGPQTLEDNPPRWTIRYANTNDLSAREIWSIKTWSLVQNSHHRPRLIVTHPEANRQFLATIHRED